MSDVKRYDPINKDGTCGVCIEDADYGAYVEYADYAALEADRDRLKTIADNYCALLMDANAELARLRAGQEPVAVVRTVPGTDWKCLDFAPGFSLQEQGELTKLYTAPQPSAVPDAVTMADVMRAWEYAEDHPHKYLRGTTNWCAAVAHSLNKQRASAPATVQGDGWIPVSERLPDVEQRLDKPCELEGKPLPPLNITSTVQCFDGTRVFADALEWFDGGQPMKGVTHWKPLDAAPAAIAAAHEGGKV